ncbi:MAG TPA: cytochrome b/b6 domain-containing protein [Mesorhizobium sp.]|jgi:cytochrome b561|nr:cytochrome b/b6 domain-containing protein [Mesorhizobium sp.]
MRSSDREAWDWSRLHIAAHWTTVALIAVQLVTAESMENWFGGAEEGEAAGAGTVMPAVFHAVSGASILVLTLLRIWDRRSHGRPPYPADHPGWATGLSKLNHLLLYVVLLAMPLLGASALASASEDLGNLHGALAPVLLALVALHVLGALAEHFYFKTDLLKRMLGRGPAAGR